MTVCGAPCGHPRGTSRRPPYRHRGTPWARTPDTAVAAALEEFGTPRAVAEAFAGELANAHARRVSLAYLLTGPVVGISWLLLLAPPDWRQQGPGALWSSIPALPLTLLGVVGGLLVLAGTGRLSRWIQPTPRRLLEMTTMLGLACIAGDLIVLAALADLATSTLDQPGILAAAAGAASLARLACSIAALHLCRRARSAFVGRAQEFSQLTAASPIAASTASPCSRASNARSRYFPEIVVAVAELDVEVVLDGVISGRSRRV